MGILPQFPFQGAFPGDSISSLGGVCTASILVGDSQDITFIKEATPD